MSLIKSKKTRTPRLGTPWLTDDPFFGSLIDPSQSLLNVNKVLNRKLVGGMDLLPSMNVKDLDNIIQVELAAPGLNKKDFNIDIEDGILTISAEKEEEIEEKDEGILRKEFSYNSFERTISIPDSVDVDKDIKAKYQVGILKISLTKKPQVIKKSKKIQVSTDR